MSKPATKAERKHMSAVADLGCIACRVIGYVGTPAEIHHLRHDKGMSMRSSHMHVIPLCPHHHRHGKYGESFHAGKVFWQERFGTEEHLLEVVTQLLEKEK
jgi:hypothetical protein